MTDAGQAMDDYGDWPTTLNEWADNPSAQGYMPVFPSTLRALADAITQLRSERDQLRAELAMEKDYANTMREKHDDLVEQIAQKDVEIARLTKAYNSAEDALTTIAVTVQPLQFKPRHDLVGNFGLAETVKQAVAALQKTEREAEALRKSVAEIARHIRRWSTEESDGALLEGWANDLDAAIAAGKPND